MDNSAFIMKSQTSVQIQNWKQKVAKTKATMRSTNITQAAFKDYEDDDEEEPDLELLRQDYAVSHNDGQLRDLFEEITKKGLHPIQQVDSPR